MANCADFSYIIYYTNMDKGIIDIQKSELNTSTLDIALVGKIRLEYGEVFNENILHLLENFAAPSLPSQDAPDTSKTYHALLSKPTAGQVWFNLTDNRPYVYTAQGIWKNFGSLDNVAGNSGVILGDGNTPLPIPVSQDGYNFSLSECTWTVSPFHFPEEIDFIHCYVNADGSVVSEYRLEGTLNLVQGFANYQVLAIRDNVNLGLVGEEGCAPGPLPSFTPTPTMTPTPSNSATITPTPTLTPSVTVSQTANITPTVTRSVTPSVSVSATPSPTPQSTPSATVTPTASLTPSVTMSATITPTISLTPSVTPSTAVNNGDVFAVAFRPYLTEDTTEAMYDRKMDMNWGTFNTSYSYTTNYFNLPRTGAPFNSRLGVMLRDWYVQVATPELLGYGVNLGVGVYPAGGLSFDTGTNQPVSITADNNVAYVGFIDTLNGGIVSSINIYDFNGAVFSTSNKLASLVNQNVDDLFTIDQNLILAKSHPILNGAETGTAFTVFQNTASFLSQIGTPSTYNDYIEAVAVLDQNNIAIIDLNNMLTRYRYDPDDGLEVVSTLNLSSLSNSPINAIQYDKGTGNLFIMYAPGNSTSQTSFTQINTTNTVYTIGTTVTYNMVTEKELCSSISVFNDRILYLDITTTSQKMMKIVSYLNGTFTQTGSIALTPNDRDVTTVSFIVPNLPRPSFTPTPSLTPSTTASVTPTPTPTSSTTPSTTPSVSPSTTPSVTPSTTASVTPTPTPSIPAQSGAGPCGGMGCDPELPNCGCRAGCVPVQNGCRCDGIDERCV